MNILKRIFMPFVLATALLLWGCSEKKGKNLEDIGSRISLASQLSSKGLYTEASEEYKAALNHPDMTDKKRSNICYMLGNMYYENLKDYEKALAWYIRAKHYDPESPALQQITERTVTCLERIGRSLDAQNVLSEATYLAGEETRFFPGKVVAQIGERKITMGELENEIQKLPPEYQKRFLANNQEKLAFLKQYVQKDLLFQMAQRAGLNKEPKIREQVGDFEKMLLAQQVYKTNVMDKINITPEEIRLYFDGHKEEIRKKEMQEQDSKTTDTKTAPLSEEDLFKKNAQLITNTLRAEKAGQQEQKLFETLLQSQNTIIYEGEFENKNP